MNKRLVFSLFAATAMVGAPGAMVSTSAVAQTICGPDVPAGWNRPGGFCDYSSGTGSLTLPLDNGGGVPCIDAEASLVDMEMLQDLAIGERIYVAQVYCDDVDDNEPPAP